MKRLIVRTAAIMLLLLMATFTVVPLITDAILRDENRSLVQFLARPDIDAQLEDDNVVVPGFLRDEGPPPHWMLIFIGVMAGVAVTTSVIWVVPLVRRLNRYQNMARRFSHGELHVRTGASGGDSIEDVGLALDEMADRIQGLLEEQEHLLQSVSHELRTPIARIRFLHEALATARSDEAAFGKRMDALDLEITELDDLVGELLTYVRLDANDAPISTEAIDLAALSEDILQRQTRSNINGQVQCRGNTTLDVHPRLARHAIKNVIGNAYRYAKSGVLVDIREDGQSVIVHVDDDGPGIPTAARQRLLQPFERIDEGRTRSMGGVGLGLAIVDRALSRHGGSVNIGESPLGGARVVMTWPKR